MILDRLLTRAPDAMPGFFATKRGAVSGGLRRNTKEHEGPRSRTKPHESTIVGARFYLTRSFFQVGGRVDTEAGGSIDFPERVAASSAVVTTGGVTTSIP